ncbi:peptidase M24 [Amanita muscaria]
MYQVCKRIRSRYILRNTFATEAPVVKPSRYGQPVFQSHPHLVLPNELTPGIPAEDYESRRRKLMDMLPDSSVAISVAAPVKYMSNSMSFSYKYRQASDFWYLTGFMEPESAIILEKTPSVPRGYRMTLFCSGRDIDKEKWDGARTSLNDALSIFRADEVQHISLFSSHLKSLLPTFSNIFVDTPESQRHGQFLRRSATSKSLLKYLTSSRDSDNSDCSQVISSIRSSRRKPLSPEVAQLRAIKSPAEQKVMRTAADISGRAHAKTMRFSRPGLTEASLAAHFEYLCSLSGAQRIAYVPVVASGPNALIIHYTHNDHVLQPNEIVLMDAGCEYNGYASDITRSFPASGTFTEPQRDLYSAVLSAQKSLIALCTERATVSLYDLHHLSCRRLREELTQIGFKSLHNGTLERVLYPHFLSHPIGIDLHESSHFDRNASLKDGMVVTIEPGIYVPPASDFPKAFHNIGIRIEDEVLVGKEHPIVLTVSAPKEISDVEGACRGLLGLEPY